MDPSHHGNNNNYAHGRRSIVSSLSGDHQERTSLFMTSLDKIMTSQSMATVADDYRLANALSGDPYSHHNTILEPEHKSSFAQSIFNSINILLGVGILALPLGFKVCCFRPTLPFINFFFLVVCRMGPRDQCVCLLLSLDQLHRQDLGSLPGG